MQPSMSVPSRLAPISSSQLAGMDSAPSGGSSNSGNEAAAAPAQEVARQGGNTGNSMLPEAPPLRTDLPQGVPRPSGQPRLPCPTAGRPVCMCSCCWSWCYANCLAAVAVVICSTIVSLEGALSMCWDLQAFCRSGMPARIMHARIRRLKWRPFVRHIRGQPMLRYVITPQAAHIISAIPPQHEERAKKRIAYIACHSMQFKNGSHHHRHLERQRNHRLLSLADGAATLLTVNDIYAERGWRQGDAGSACSKQHAAPAYDARHAQPRHVPAAHDDAPLHDGNAFRCAALPGQPPMFASTQHMTHRQQVEQLGAWHDHR